MKITTTIINHKKYTVERVFNMVVNYHFIAKDGTEYLVDAEDVTRWLGEGKWRGINTVIDYAKFLAKNNEGIFWWKIK